MVLVYTEVPKNTLISFLIILTRNILLNTNVFTFNHFRVHLRTIEQMILMGRKRMVQVKEQDQFGF